MSTNVAISQNQSNYTSVEVDSASNDSSSYNSSNVVIPQIPAYIRTTSMVFCICIMILGLIGNIMVPIVILKTKDMRNSTNIFLTNLSLADLLVLLVCTPTMLVEVNTRPDTWVLGNGMCKTVPFVELTVAHASVLTILAISFERYYAICEPLKAGYVCTKTRALLICVLAWTIAAFFTSPILWIAEYKYEEYIDGSLVAVCLTQAVNTWAIGFFLMTISLFFVLPLITLLVLYGIIAKNLISSDGPMMKIRPTKPEFSLKARKQVVMMLGAVVLSFFICLMPFRVLTLWIILSSQQSFLALGVEKYYNILYFSRIMFYLNSAINPILYNLMSTKFRKGFFKLYSFCWERKFKIFQNHQKRIAITSNTTSNTNTTTSSSFLSRSSNRRSSLDLKNNINIIVPLCVDSEILENLKQPSNSEVASSSIGRRLTLEQTINEQEPFTTLASSADIVDDLSAQQNFRITNYRIKCKRQISFDETVTISGSTAHDGKLIQHKSLDTEPCKQIESEIPQTNVRKIFRKW